jgi:hypothetical protein
MAQIETALAQNQSMRPWMDLFVVLIMATGGAATMAWIAAMLVAGWQMAVLLVGLSVA